MYNSSSTSGVRHFVAGRSEARRLWRSKRRANCRNARQHEVDTQCAAALQLRLATS